MKLSAEAVKKIAHLARLEVSEQEVDKFSTQLSSILEYVEHLNDLDTSGVTPIASTLGQATPLREDVAISNPARTTILEHAPDREGPLFKVPKVI